MIPSLRSSLLWVFGYIWYMTTVRIYNDPKDKRTFTRQMLSDENISLQDVNIGFIGASNQKSFVNTSSQVYDAYNSTFLYKHNELMLFIERHEEKRQTKTEIL